LRQHLALQGNDGEIDVERAHAIGRNENAAAAGQIVVLADLAAIMVGEFDNGGVGERIARIGPQIGGGCHGMTVADACANGTAATHTNAAAIRAQKRCARSEAFRFLTQPGTRSEDPDRSPFRVVYCRARLSSRDLARFLHTRKSAMTFIATPRTSAQRAAFDIVSIVPSISMLWTTLPPTMTTASDM
jgi:hypothetical protein